MRMLTVLFLFFPFIFSCGDADRRQEKAVYSDILDLKAFSIKLPDGWHYAKANGVDSFVGSFVTNKADTLFFDFSTMGYASHLREDEQLHNIRIDTTDKYFIKTVWPKEDGKGITGVCIQSRKSSLDMQISGSNLPKAQQELALAAFKTIKIKVEGSGSPLPFK